MWNDQDKREKTVKDKNLVFSNNLEKNFRAEKKRKKREKCDGERKVKEEGEGEEKCKKKLWKTRREGKEGSGRKWKNFGYVKGKRKNKLTK